MKLKLSLDKNTIQQFFVNHVEKTLFGGIVVCFLFFVVQAIGRERFDKTPQDLVQATESADQHLNDTKPEADREPAPYPDRAKRSRIRIEERFYAHTATWNPAEFPQRSKRGEPKLFTVQKLRGMAGAGPFSLSASGMGADRASMAREKARKEKEAAKRRREKEKDEKRNRKSRDDEKKERGSRMAEMSLPTTRGERWIVLTGLVPITEQEEAFQQVFTDVQYRNPQTDVPDYIYYRVERVEVDSRGEAAELEWVLFNLRKVLDEYAKKTGGGGGQDTIDSRYLHPILTFPLGPLVGRQWGEEVAHPDEIALRPKRRYGIPGDAKRPGEAEKADPKTPKSDDPIFDMPGVSPSPRTRGTRRSQHMPGEMMPGAYSRRGAGFPGGERMYADSAVMGVPQVEEIPYLLFRSFDFNVKPGKKYRYRVRLLLRNPNYDVDPRWLADKKLGAERWIQSEWSDPTDVISVPYDDRLLATGVKASAVAAVEPFAKVMLVHQDQKTGLEASDEVNRVVRGKLMDYLERKAELAVPGGTHQRYERDVDFLTGAIMLDIRGGQRIRGKDSSMTQPGRMLVLDVDGNLIVRNELDDLTEALVYRKPEKKKTLYPQDMMPTEMMPGGYGEGNLDALGGGLEKHPRRKKPRPRTTKSNR